VGEGSDSIAPAADSIVDVCGSAMKAAINAAAATSATGKEKRENFTTTTPFLAHRFFHMSWR
jgi:hypothetical protein